MLGIRTLHTLLLSLRRASLLQTSFDEKIEPLQKQDIILENKLIPSAIPLSSLTDQDEKSLITWMKESAGKLAYHSCWSF